MTLHDDPARDSSYRSRLGRADANGGPPRCCVAGRRVLVRLRDAARRRARRDRLALAQGRAGFGRCLPADRDSGQIRRVAQFIASTYDGQTFPYDLFELRALDVEISDDMLLCLDALRWGKADLYKLVPDGERRVQEICANWGFTWPQG